MEKLIEFVSNNYVWFLTITIILLFSLIGYIYDTKKKKESPIEKAEDAIDEDYLEKLKVEEGKSLQDYMSNINTTNQGVNTEKISTEESTNSNEIDNNTTN